VTKAKEKTCGT